MFYHLLWERLGVNLFRYITFRSAMAAITAFLIGTILGPWVIGALRRRAFMEKPLNPDAPQLDQHRAEKHDTPTMGGLLMIIAIMPAVTLWARPGIYTFLGLFTVAFLGAVGLADDYLKMIQRRKRGLSKTLKIVLQVVLAVALGIVLYHVALEMKWGTHFVVPFFKNIDIQLGLVGFLVVTLLVIVGSSNAVNLTDGMDGLAIGCTAMASVTYVLISYLVGHSGFAWYLNIPYVPEAGELAVFCAALTGAGLAFLWFNCFPAQVFMGDTGSLALGGALGYVAIVTRTEVLLFVVGGIFVIEAVSVILQIIWVRLLGRRLFRMAPIHHHFQLGGWKETKVVFRFLIVAALLSAFALATLKIR